MLTRLSSPLTKLRTVLGEFGRLLRIGRIDGKASFLESLESSFSVGPINYSGRIKAMRYNYAMLLCYNGHRYYGMQWQKTDTEWLYPQVELHLLNAFHKLRLINDEERRIPSQFRFDRASRTDRGVSAAKQICSMVLPLGGRRKYVDGDVFYTPETVVYHLNQLLPEDIRVIGVKRVTPKFNARRFCDFRHYTYTLPSYAFSPKDEIDIHGYRLSVGRWTLVNEILSMYIGQHNFFNFTRQRKPDERQSIRIIRRCECSEPFIRNGMEFLTIHIVGNSFMYHQIRKMVGLCIAILRGYTGKEAVEKCWQPFRFDVPIAPSLGLVLNDLYFDGYYKHYQRTHEAVTWDEFEDKLRDFRERCIESRIIEAESNGESQMPKWLQTLEKHGFEQTLLKLATRHRDSVVEDIDDESSDCDDERRKLAVRS